MIYTALILLGLLARTKGSRIVVVSALAHVFFDMDIHDLNFTTKEPGFFEIYSTSKLCNILFTKELARKLENSGMVLKISTLIVLQL